MFETQELVEVTVLPDDIRLRATIKHIEGQHLLFTVAPADAPMFKPGTTVQFMRPHLGGLYVCDATVVNRRDTMVVAKTEVPQLLQRRRARRFHCDQEMYYRSGISLPNLMESENSNLEVGRIYDLSTGGAQFYSSAILFANTPIGVRIYLSPTDKIHAEASVIRCTKAARPVQFAEILLTHMVAIRFGCVPRYDQVQLLRFLTHPG